MLMLTTLTLEIWSLYQPCDSFSTAFDCQVKHRKLTDLWRSLRQDIVNAIPSENLCLLFGISTIIIVHYTNLFICFESGNVAHIKKEHYYE